MLAQPEVTCQVLQACYQQVLIKGELQAVAELVRDGLYLEGALSGGAP